MYKESRTRWFDELGRRTGQSHEAHELVLDVPVGGAAMQQIKQAGEDYVARCFQLQGEDIDFADAGAFQDDKWQRLANRTPNGILRPKQELEREFNRLHAAVASWVEVLGAAELMPALYCPINLRAVKGAGSAQEAGRPYASSKKHLDLWTGEPADTVNVMIMVLGDIGRTTVEFYEVPALGEEHLRVLDDYHDAADLIAGCRPYDVKPEYGHAYFSDAVVPHKTVRDGGGVRVSIDLRLRRPVAEEERRVFERLCHPGRLANFVPRDEWLGYGRKTRLQFPETFEDARQGRVAGNSHNTRSYVVAGVADG